ncbi:hypothetical protein LZ30DRAFT_109728 [Colletotrichum cereale]|nr:hypothetical protein LZ30DRAFT_109728 [Colletotrichum cereale]
MVLETRRRVYVWCGRFAVTCRCRTAQSAGAANKAKTFRQKPTLSCQAAKAKDREKYETGAPDAAPCRPFAALRNTQGIRVTRCLSTHTSCFLGTYSNLRLLLHPVTRCLACKSCAIELVAFPPPLPFASAFLLQAIFRRETYLFSSHLGRHRTTLPSPQTSPSLALLLSPSCYKRHGGCRLTFKVDPLISEGPATDD